MMSQIQMEVVTQLIKATSGFVWWESPLATIQVQKGKYCLLSCSMVQSVDFIGSLAWCILLYTTLQVVHQAGPLFS